MNPLIAAIDRLEQGRLADEGTLEAARSEALLHAEVLESLIEGEAGDELGRLLTPIASFLRDLSMAGGEVSPEPDWWGGGVGVLRATLTPVPCSPQVFVRPQPQETEVMNPDAILVQSIYDDPLVWGRLDGTGAQELIDHLEEHVPHDELPRCYERLIALRDRS